MVQENNIYIYSLGRFSNINFNTLKGGLKKTDLQNNEQLIEIFNKFDTDKNGVLTQNELSVFSQSLQPYTENEIFSKREAKKYAKEQSLNIKRQDILDFIKKAEITSEKVEKTYNTEIEGKDIYAIQYKANEKGEIITEFYDAETGKLNAQTTTCNNTQNTSFFNKNGDIIFQTKKLGSITEHYNDKGNLIKKEVDRGNGLKDITVYNYDYNTNELKNSITKLYDGTKIIENSNGTKTTISAQDTLENSTLGQKFNIDYLRKNFPKDKYKWDENEFNNSRINNELQLYQFESIDGNEFISINLSKEKADINVLNKQTGIMTTTKYNEDGDLLILSSTKYNEETDEFEILSFTRYNVYGNKIYEINQNNERKYDYSSYNSNTQEITSKQTLDSNMIESIISKDYYEQERFNDERRANGKIDNHFRQGETGDCWLLASIKAIADTPNGLKILNDSINVQENGDIKVTLKGIKKTYTITKEELLAKEYLSTGDRDVRALEIAMEKYFEEANGDETTGGKKTIKGNNEHIAYKILLGDNGTIKVKHYKKLNDEDIENFNKKNHVSNVAIDSNKKEVIKIINDDNQEIVIYPNHSYVATSADANNVTLINPHNTSEPLPPIPRRIFQKLFNALEEIDVLI